MVGAACVWRTREGWTGRRFRLGSNKEAFDAETFAIYQALRAFDQRQESGRRYTIFVDSIAAISRVRDDTMDPGQRFAVAAIDVCSRIITRDVRGHPRTQAIRGWPGPYTDGLGSVKGLATINKSENCLSN